MSTERELDMCQYCKAGNLVDGTLEGVSFQPKSEAGKLLSSGIYGITVKACSNCGRLSALAIDPKNLQKLLRRK